MYSQWFAGKFNVATDSLSRDLYFLSMSSHEKFLQKIVPHQLPANFKIHRVPEEISSFISSMLQQLPVKTQRLLPQKPSEIALGIFGENFCAKLASQNQRFCSNLTITNVISSCQHSLKHIEKGPCLEEINKIWWREQSTPPSHMWRRPSSQTTGLTPDWTKTVKPVSY